MFKITETGNYIMRNGMAIHVTATDHWGFGTFSDMQWITASGYFAYGRSHNHEHEYDIVSKIEPIEVIKRNLFVEVYASDFSGLPVHTLSIEINENIHHRIDLETFSPILESIRSGQKIQAIKDIRKLLNIGLRVAKDLIEDFIAKDLESQKYIGLISMRKAFNTAIAESNQYAAQQFGKILGLPENHIETYLETKSYLQDT